MVYNMAKTTKTKLLIIKSARYIPIIALITLLTLALIRANVAPAGGDINPKDACPF